LGCIQPARRGHREHYLVDCCPAAGPPGHRADKNLVYERRFSFIRVTGGKSKGEMEWTN